MIIPTLFGTTAGLEVIQIPISSNGQTIQLDNVWIEISQSIATLRPNKEILVIQRKLVGTNIATWIGLYRPALEIGFDRPGSFYGAGVWVINNIIKEKPLTEILISIANQIQSLTMNNGQFIKRIAEIRAEIKIPIQLESFIENRSKINAGCSPSGNIAFITENLNPLDVLEWAQRAQSASYFSKVIIGSNDQTPSTSTTIQVFPSLASAINFSFTQRSNEILNTQSGFQKKEEQYLQNISNKEQEKLNMEVLQKKLLEEIERNKAENQKIKFENNQLTLTLAKLNRREYNPNIQDIQRQRNEEQRQRITNNLAQQNNQTKIMSHENNSNKNEKINSQQSSTANSLGSDNLTKLKSGPQLKDDSISGSSKFIKWLMYSLILILILLILTIIKINYTPPNCLFLQIECYNSRHKPYPEENSSGNNANTRQSTTAKVPGSSASVE